MELSGFINEIGNSMMDLQNPAGTEDHPGRTCKDLKRCGKVSKDGKSLSK